MIFTKGFSSVNKEAVEAEKHKLRELTQRYHTCDTYNMDETALLWEATPGRTLSTKASSDVKVEKAQVTLADCGNADSSDKAFNMLLF